MTTKRNMDPDKHTKKEAAGAKVMDLPLENKILPNG